MKISKKHTYVLDIETEGPRGTLEGALGRTTNKIVDVGLRNLNTGENVSYSSPKEHLKLLQIIAKHKLKIICHNGTFDITNIMFHYGVDLSECLFMDTLVLARVTHSDLEKNDLEFLAVKYLGAKPWKKGAKKTGNDDYLFSDLIHTGNLAKLFTSQMSKEDKKVFKWLMSTYRSFIRIQYNGIPIDIKHLNKAIEQYHKHSADMRNLLNKVSASKTKGINWNSSKQLVKFLYEENGIPVRRRTAKGAPQTSANALNEIIAMGDDIPLTEFIDAALPKANKDWGICRTLLAYKAIEKSLQMLLDWRAREHAGRLYPYINIVGARTGRTSSSEPNIQQVPRAKILRNCFNSTKKNMLFGEFDYSQIELRVAAYITRDKTMLAAYKKGIDLHSLTQKSIFSDYDHDDKEQRTAAKQVNFGFLYGREAQGFYNQMIDSGLSMTLNDAKQWRADFFKRYKGLPAYYKAIEIEALQDGGVSTPIGRFRPYPEVYGNYKQKAEALRSAVNNPIQSFASDILISSCVEVNKLDGVTACATVHDAILVEVDLDILTKEEAEEQIKEIMENPPILEVFDIEFDVPLEVDADWGAWGGA